MAMVLEAATLCTQALEAAARVDSVRQVLSLGPELGEIVSSGQSPPAVQPPVADSMAILPYIAAV
jgi:hypothetical protein